MTNPINLADYTQGRSSTDVPKLGRRALTKAFDQLRKLHTPIAVCRGCCSPECSGDCDWADAYDGELLLVCAHCCFDPDVGKQNYPCLDYHDHGVEHGPDRPICATRQILDATTKAG